MSKIVPDYLNGWKLIDEESQQSVVTTITIDTKMTKASGTAEEQRAIEYLRWTGWLEAHDREIYEQGQREGKPIGVGKWITKSKRNPLEEWSWRECSVCGWCREDDSTANDTPFCPMCGAIMKEGD